jgi:hypothetical protein
MHDLVILFAQPLRDSHGYAHIREKSHPRRRSTCDDLFLCKPGRVFQCLLHIRLI